MIEGNLREKTCKKGVVSKRKAVPLTSIGNFYSCFCVLAIISTVYLNFLILLPFYPFIYKLKDLRNSLSSNCLT